MSANLLRPLIGAALVACTISLFGLTAGCSGCEEEQVDPAVLASLADDRGVQISLKLKESERRRAAILVAKVSEARFPSRLVKRKHNAKLFLYVAAKSDQQQIIIAALEAIKKAYGAANSAGGGRPPANDDYGVVVAAHLKSKSPKIQAAALTASRNALAGSPPHPAALAGVADIAKSHSVAGGRIAAISALTKVPRYQTDATVAGAFLAALDHEHPAVLSYALSRLYQKGAQGLVLRDKFLPKARELLTHKDPGVRGRAARLAAVLGKGDAKLTAQIRLMLGDQHPYVRSIVPHALADIGDVPSIHKLVSMVEDFARNNHHIRYRALGGRRTAVPHGAKAETVHDPVVKAIETLSAASKEPFKRVSTESNSAARKKNAAAAKAWYKSHQAELPKLGAVAEAGKGSPQAEEKGKGDEPGPGQAGKEKK